MTDRTETDRVCRKWSLIRRIDEERAHVRAGLIDAWRYYRYRTPSQQREFDIVLSGTLSMLARCDRMEKRVKRNRSTPALPNGTDAP